MDPYWFLYNPLTDNLLNILFGIVLVIGVGLLIMNIIRLATSRSRIGPVIGSIISLFIIGIAVSWETILPIIAQTMGGVMQYFTIYIYMLISQWLAQQAATTTATALLLLP
jgi:hypothetical protein